jgi:hypothetical protein
MIAPSSLIVNVIAECIVRNGHHRIGAIHESPALIASFATDIAASGQFTNRPRHHSPMTIIASIVIETPRLNERTPRV